MARLSAGALPHLLTFQTPQTSDDGYNTQTWLDAFKKRGRIETKNTAENEYNGQVSGETTVVITLRYAPKIKANMRIIYGERVFEIVGEPLNVNFSNKVTKITARAVTNA